MAETTVEMRVEKLKQLLLQHAHVIPDAGNQVESLKNSLDQFKALEKGVETAVVRDLIQRIRHAVYDAEDVIDAYVIQADDAILGLPSIADIVEEVEAVVENLKSIFVR